MPAPQKNSATSRASGAPPEVATSKRPPRRSLILPKTSLSASVELEAEQARRALAFEPVGKRLFGDALGPTKDLLLER